VLDRRPVTAGTVTHIGKEANRLEEAQAGLIQSTDEILGAYDESNQVALGEWALPTRGCSGARGRPAYRAQRRGGPLRLSGETLPRATGLKQYIRVAETDAQ
jgi:hypothetical protein